MSADGGHWRLAPRWAASAAALCAVACLSSPAFGDAGNASRVPKPAIEFAAPGKCVEDTQFMLRNHMELLKHHRDVTVHEGVRTTAHSLANCVACHASRTTGRVTGSKDAFCEGCHRYAAVRLDCFECHSDRAPGSVAASAASVGAHMSAAGPPQGANYTPSGGSAAASAASVGAHQ